MFSANLWIDTRPVNGAIGTVQAICYKEGGAPQLCVDIDKKKFFAGLTFVVISRVRCLTDLLLNSPISFQCFSSKSQKAKELKKEKMRKGFRSNISNCHLDICSAI